MSLLKSILNFVKPPPDSVEPVQEFILDLEPDVTPVPMGSIEESKLLEQATIEKYEIKNLQNKRNSIAKSNPI